MPMVRQSVKFKAGWPGQVPTAIPGACQLCVNDLRIDGPHAHLAHRLSRRNGPRAPRHRRPLPAGLQYRQQQRVRRPQRQAFLHADRVLGRARHADASCRSCAASCRQSAVIRLADDVPRRIVVLATKEPHCLGDLLIRHEFGDLARPDSGGDRNHETLGDLVRKFDIPFPPPQPRRDRHGNEHEAAVLEANRPRMRPITSCWPSTCGSSLRHSSGSFPSGSSTSIIRSCRPSPGPGRTARRSSGESKIIGATAHFVNSGLDTGPIIAQDVIPVDHSHSADDMARAGRDVEQIRPGPGPAAGLRRARLSERESDDHFRLI